MKAVGRAAKGMVEEVRRQFRSKCQASWTGERRQPDYATPVSISTLAAQREMIIPAHTRIVDANARDNGAGSRRRGCHGTCLSARSPADFV